MCVRRYFPHASRRARVRTRAGTGGGFSWAGALACAAALALGGASTAVAKTPHHKFTAANWDGPEQRLVVGDAVMSEVGGSAGFGGAAPLSAQDESSALAAIATRLQLAPLSSFFFFFSSSSSSSTSLTLVRFDALLVDQLGLGDVAEHVQQVAAAAGLEPPSYFGSEVVARFLDLRYNHPAGEDSLELYPWNPITRAEAAHSFAAVLGMESWALEAARETLSSFSLPQYTPDQRKVLRVAVSKIGMPYVWGGTTDNNADGLEHGGYDCSGFAWRVYKVSGLPWGREIHGRTAAQQAGEIPKSTRIHLSEVQPADLLFFGSAHFDSSATEADIIHEGIALSGQWAIHSSDQGVYVMPLDSGWLAQQFAWARRVL